MTAGGAFAVWATGFLASEPDVVSITCLFSLSIATRSAGAVWFASQCFTAVEGMVAMADEAPPPLMGLYQNSSASLRWPDKRRIRHWNCLEASAVQQLIATL